MRSTAIQPPAVPLTDGVVSLRYRRAADLDAICAASHDPETRRWLSAAGPSLDREQGGHGSTGKLVFALRKDETGPGAGPRQA